jgi:hypothetical protein
VILLGFGFLCGFYAAILWETWIQSLYEPRQWTPQQREAMSRLREEHLRGTR